MNTRKGELDDLYAGILDGEFLESSLAKDEVLAFISRKRIGFVNYQISLLRIRRMKALVSKLLSELYFRYYCRTGRFPE